MKNGGKTLIYAAGCIVLALAARAGVRSPGESESDKELSVGNPYGAIVERNVFDLHDPPVHDAKDDKPKEPPPNIKLNGITTIFGNKQALFTVNRPGAAGKPPTTRSLMLAERQRSEDLEVLEIDPQARTARIKIDQIESLIHIETNKTAGGGPAPTAGVGGAPGAHVPGVFSGAPPGRGGYIPSRPLRTENAPGASQPNYGGAPQRQYGGGATTPVVQPSLTPEQTYTLLEAQRATTTDPILSQIIPPTPLSQPQPQQQQTSPTTPATPGSTLPPALQPKINGFPVP